MNWITQGRGINADRGRIAEQGLGGGDGHPGTLVTDLLTGLAEHNIGAMVVVGPDGVVGIVSERDVVRKLHELRRRAARCSRSRRS